MVLEVLERVDAIERGMVTTSRHHYQAKEDTTKAIAAPQPAQPSKPWVGLTEFDIDQIPYGCSHADSRLIAYAIEAKLREMNT